MVEQQRQRVEQEMTKMVDDFDRSYLRKMQAEMHRCAAKCCEDQGSSLDSVHRCVDRCSTPLTRAQKYVQGELEAFQGRLQRCVMQCNDDIKVQMSPNPKEDEIAKFTAQFERCAAKCVDKHLGSIPSMAKNVKVVLAEGHKAIPDS